MALMRLCIVAFRVGLLELFNSTAFNKNQFIKIKISGLVNIFLAPEFKSNFICIENKNFYLKNSSVQRAIG